MTKFPTNKRIINKAWKDFGIDDAILWEVVPVKDGEVVVFQFESAILERKQGIWVAVDGYMEYKNQKECQACYWLSSPSDIVKLRVFSKENLLHFYNVWFSPHSLNNMGSQSYSSGMLREETPKGARYKCNDVGFEKGFNSLVFNFNKVA